MDILYSIGIFPIELNSKRVGNTMYSIDFIWQLQAKLHFNKCVLKNISVLYSEKEPKINCNLLAA